MIDIREEWKNYIDTRIFNSIKDSQGITRKMIAIQLDMSPQTVFDHIKDIKNIRRMKSGLRYKYYTYNYFKNNRSDLIKQSRMEYIYEYVVQHPCCLSGEIVESLKIERSAVSTYLKKLCSKGKIIRSGKCGKYMYEK